MKSPRWRPFMAYTLLSLFVVGLMIHPVCDLLFGCGCTPIWQGGVDDCTLLESQVSTPDACPWCAASWWVLAVSIGVPLVASSVVGWWVHRRLSWKAGIVATLLTALLCLLSIGFSYGKVLGFKGPPESGALCGSLGLGGAR